MSEPPRRLGYAPGMPPAAPSRPRILPVDLGGATSPCEVMPPRRPPPPPELVAALIAQPLRDRPPRPGDRVEVGFFHGGLPTPAQLRAASGLPLRLSVHPRDLRPEHLEPLIAAGLEVVELEVLTLDDSVLRPLRRGYTGEGALRQLRALRRAGLRVGAHLWPGLPGSSHGTLLSDLDRLLRADGGPLVDHLRLLPALALEGSGLARMVAAGRWAPMTLGQAVTCCAAALDLAEAAGVTVIRVGLQPGPDLPVRVTAGPWHAGLRGLVQRRRWAARLADALAPYAGAGDVEVHVNPADLPDAQGVARETVRGLRGRLSLPGLELRGAADLPRGALRVRAAGPPTPDPHLHARRPAG